MLNTEEKGLYKNYLSDKSYEKKRTAKKVEIALKYEIWRPEVVTMNKNV